MNNPFNSFIEVGKMVKVWLDKHFTPIKKPKVIELRPNNHYHTSGNDVLGRHLKYTRQKWNYHHTDYPVQLRLSKSIHDFNDTLDIRMHSQGYRAEGDIPILDGIDPISITDTTLLEVKKLLELRIAEGEG